METVASIASPWAAGSSAHRRRAASPCGATAAARNLRLPRVSCRLDGSIGRHGHRRADLRDAHRHAADAFACLDHRGMHQQVDAGGSGAVWPSVATIGCATGTTMPSTLQATVSTCLDPRLPIGRQVAARGQARRAARARNTRRMMGSPDCCGRSGGRRIADRHVRIGGKQSAEPRLDHVPHVLRRDAEGGQGLRGRGDDMLHALGERGIADRHVATAGGIRDNVAIRRLRAGSRRRLDATRPEYAEAGCAGSGVATAPGMRTAATMPPGASAASACTSGVRSMSMVSPEMCGDGRSTPVGRR